MKHSFTTLDIIIFGASLVISSAIGLFYAIKSMRNKGFNNEEFLLGGRSMPLIPTSLSLMSSVVSGILILGYPAEIYVLGTAVCWTSVGAVAALCVAGAFFVPVVFRSITSASAYGYFQLRFQSRAIRICASVLFSLSTLIYMAVVLYAPAAALASVTDVPSWILILVVGVVCTAYTSVGGLKAVVWTDAVQAVIMYGGLIAMLVLGVGKVGSWDEVWERSLAKGRLSGAINIDPNPFQYMTVWTATVGGFFYWLNSWAVSQTSLQRYISVPRLRDAWTIILLTIPFLCIICCLAYMIGLTIFAHYDSLGCDPITSKQIKGKDELVMFYMVEIFREFDGLPGLFLACIFSGTLSSVSAGVNSLSAVGWEEFIRPYLQHRRRLRKESEEISQRTASIATKALGCVYGMASIGMAFTAEPLGGIFDAVNATLTTAGGPVTGLMILAVMFPMANAKGSFAGVFAGIALSLWIFIGAQINKGQPGFSTPFLSLSTQNCSFNNSIDSLTTVSAMTIPWTTQIPSAPGFQFNDIYKLNIFMFSTVGAVVTVVVGLIVSALTGGSGNIRYERPELFFHWWWRRQPIGARGKMDRS